MNDIPAHFDPERMGSMIFERAHPGWLDLEFHEKGANWVELKLPWREDLVGDPDFPVLASGPIVSLLDMAGGMCIWTTNRVFKPVATLDLRVDYQRPARDHAAVYGRTECYRLTRSAAFVRGFAHDGDPEDTVATMVGVFMTINPGRANG
ncbi:PaaI family thioesterase [Qipengyuania oceanensis]|uniref:Hotdog fold thioesterase n=1 Tax=Qipengyuania oceanensis TaxID=1463597 RepID=A0A844YJR9_9SPHN|nr:PaaI family thioesterase [Qipengyuania oceanensis]MXO63569.1 hotdog fold thioesterase [Qipengyuania oceanensis]